MIALLNNQDFARIAETGGFAGLIYLSDELPRWLRTVYISPVIWNVQPKCRCQPFINFECDCPPGGKICFVSTVFTISLIRSSLSFIIFNYSVQLGPNE